MLDAQIAGASGAGGPSRHASEDLAIQHIRGPVIIL